MKMNKKTLGWILMILGALVLGTGLVMRFAFRNTAVTFDAAALGLIGLSLSLEYKGEKYRRLLWVFQALAGLVIIANAVSWFVTLPHPSLLVIRLFAIAANLPLAALGLKKTTPVLQDQSSQESPKEDQPSQESQEENEE